MNLLLSLILFFTHSTAFSVAVDAIELNTKTESILEVSEIDGSGDFFKALPVEETKSDFEFIENTEEEETESENEVSANCFQGFDNGLIRGPSSNLFNSFFSTKAKFGEIPLYTLFHSWKAYLS